MYEWDSVSGKRTGEYVLKNCSYTGVGLSVDGKNMFAVGSDKKLKEISDSQVNFKLKNINSRYKHKKTQLNFNTFPNI